MRLICILLAVLAISFAEEAVNDLIEDSEAVASVELLKTAADSSGSSNYIPPSQRPPRGWNSGYQQNWTPPPPPYQPTWPPQENTWTPPPNTWNPPQNNYAPIQNTWTPPPSTWNPPQNNWTPPQNVYKPPQNIYKPPSYVPGWDQNQVQNDPPTNYWTAPPTYVSTTTPVPVIKNEQYYGDNGSYKYEYQIADGTHVGEEGYVLHPNTEHESLVKKGWYSYTGADGKVYTVTWWADETGFHASGDHLPKPPPVPPAIQAAIDQNAKEEAAKLEAEKNKQQHGYYPQQQQQHHHHHHDQQQYPQQQQTYYPPQQSYQPPQQTYYPQQNPNYTA